MNHTNETAGQSAGGVEALKTSKAAREKTWDECGIEEKVERLRRELLNTRDTAMGAYRNAAEVRDLAQRHQHNPATGEVLRSAERMDEAKLQVSIMQRIWEARADYLRSHHGDAPAALYLGREDWRDLRRESDSYLRFPSDALKPQLFGMRVYEVCEERHLNVTAQCGDREGDR